MLEESKTCRRLPATIPTTHKSQHFEVSFCKVFEIYFHQQYVCPDLKALLTPAPCQRARGEPQLHGVPQDVWGLGERAVRASKLSKMCRWGLYKRGHGIGDGRKNVNIENSEFY
tara:strand:- start:1121 stop:1462 length:342 start_codon:yes stop_codon:yes gene_type:complete